MPKPCNVALIGQKFMGRAHSNAWNQVGHFFDSPRTAVLHTIAARNLEELKPFASQWGWQHCTDRWMDLAENADIDLVDIGTPNDVHAEQALAMLAAGKHVACEKPLSSTLAEARTMRDAAKKAKVKTFVWFNYRRCPAIALAHQFIKEGKLGKIRHVRATYLQSWGGADVPLLWRFQKKRAGSGAHGDLNAHIVDLARFLTGDEVAEINGAICKTFIKKRAIIGKPGKMGRSDVDDMVSFLATFKKGATASFEASRLAHGHENSSCIEINGEQGSLRFDFEDMNVLWLFEAGAGPREQGWKRIMCTSADGNHPYAANWWPDAHVLGYEHGFINMAADILRVMGGKKPLVPLPDFADAYETQRVLEAALLAAAEGRTVRMSEVQ